MGILKKVKLLQGAKSVILGVTDALGITSVLKANRDSEHKTDLNGKPTGKGKIDFIRLVVAVAVIIGFVLVLMGKAEMQTFKDLLKLLM